MVKSKYVLTYSLLLLLTLQGFAQHTRQLLVVDTVRLPEQQEGGLAIMEPMKCSPEGDLYVRFARGTPELGVTVVSEDNQHIYRLDTTNLPELNGSYLLDFAPGSNHTVFFLVGRRTEPKASVEHDIVTLRDDGTKTITRIDSPPGASLRQIAVLGSDSFAIAGYVQATGRGEKPFLGIFDDRGQFQREVTLKGDLQPKDVVRSKLMSNRGQPVDAFVGWLEVSSLQTAGDGRAYLMRRSPEGPVFLISPGAAVKKVKLKPPEKGAVLSSVKIGTGVIAAEYYMSDSSSHTPRMHYLTLTDLVHGRLQQVIRYQGGQSVGVGMVCYGEKGFEFLSQDSDGYLEAVTAAGR